MKFYPFTLTIKKYYSTNKVHILELGIGLYPGKGRRYMGNLFSGQFNILQIKKKTELRNKQV